MKNKSVLITLFFLITSITFANVRAPYHADGAYSGHPEISPVSQIFLAGENLSISFPRITVDKFAPYSEQAMVDVQPEYLVINRSNTPIILPVAFLGVQMHKFSARLNGKPLEIKTEQNKTLSRDFFKKIVTQRFNWNNDAHYNFISFLKFHVEKKTGIPKNQQKLSDILKILEDDNVVKRLFHHYIYPLATISFRLELKPGLNSLKIRYNQRMNYNERGTRYGSFIVERAVFTFDYLLYPALSWKTTQDFKLKIAVILPDIKEERIFKDRYYALKYDSSVNLAAVYQPSERNVVLTGEFPNFPQEIFAMVLKKGVRR